MPKSDNINTAFNKFEKITVNISNILDSKAQLDSNIINELEKLYAMKNQQLVSINQYFNSEEFKRIPEKNKLQFKNKLVSFIEHDKRQINKIEGKAGELKTKILRLSKQKRLLKYNKGTSL
ncbi:MAG: hypothetical protein ABSG15_07090 [FCB group bacterium]|jgi:hypothetical protein